MTDIKNIRVELKRLRKDNKMTLAKVSEDTGLSISFISDIERGRTNPSVKTIDKLAACYGVVCNVIFDT